MKRPAPIAVFAYDRAELLQRTLAALARCEGFEAARVHLYCDAPAEASRRAAVEATRQTARTWCEAHGARWVARETHLGFRNLTEGLSELCADEGRVISLEDDQLADPGLLAFLDRTLEAYAPAERVFQVAAYRPGVPLRAAPDTFFLPMPMPAAWGTWARAWSHFRWEVSEASEVLNDDTRRRAFDLDGAYPASELLRRALTELFPSYFIRWYLAMFLAEAWALCSREALVFNIGLASGVHGRSQISPAREQFINGAWNEKRSDPSSWRLPERVEIDSRVFEQICAGLRERARDAIRAQP